MNNEVHFKPIYYTTQKNIKCLSQAKKKNIKYIDEINCPHELGKKKKVV